MKLKEFIENFVEPNTLIRLHYKIQGGHEEVCGEKPQMEWKLKVGEYADREVVGVTDIVYLKSHYTEAVNLTIQREETDNSNCLDRTVSITPKSDDGIKKKVTFKFSPELYVEGDSKIINNYI